jgi:3-hydroxybutyryl-CoA dehydrogenase
MMNQMICDPPQARVANATSFHSLCIHFLFEEHHMALHSGDNRPITTTSIFPQYGKAGMAHLAPAEVARPFSRVGILGAGETGMGVARSLLEADIPVTVFELEREALDLATAAARSDYQNAVGDGELTASQRDRRVALLAATINLHHLKDCDVIVDTLDAGGDVKDGLLRRLNEVAKPNAVLMVCTANADVDRTAALMRFPENVVGMRWSNGAGAEQWELVPAKVTSERALATASWVVQNLGMSPMAETPRVS